MYKIKVEDLIKDPEICDDLLISLDTIAQHTDAEKYGLPIYHEADRSHLREAIYKWVVENFYNEDKN